ncbi:hypothetical protein OG738_24045 [Amycolatopsis sp. NBC_01488]|uniref:DUF6879 family protein n=1 Tax=Amycolatopsis sp. NBC_01488 TaxID=2903563 RepID=UPI002E29C9AA|nr:DUF6879 family protein [Amycolatopsis sp. NBC_01488]
MLLRSEELGRLFRTFRLSAFRLETFPVYDVASEREEYDRFLAGEKPPADLHYGWLDIVAGHREAGRSMQRVRVVSRPLTDYVRYEFEWGFQFNVRSGEDIRILDLTNRALDLPQQDFWFFDDSTIVRLDYDEDGAVSGRMRLDRPDLAQYRAWRDLALTESVPFREYRT